MWDQVKKKKPLIPVKKSGGGPGDGAAVDVPNIDDVMSKADAVLDKAKKAEAQAAKHKQEQAQSPWGRCSC